MDMESFAVGILNEVKGVLLGTKEGKRDLLEQCGVR